MNPLDPAILAGSTSAGGKIPPAARVKTLTDEAQRELDEAQRVILETEKWLQERVAEEGFYVIDSMNHSIGDISREATRVGNIAARTAKKAVESLDALAGDEMMWARRAVEAVGGTLPVLLEDAAAYKMADEWELPALEMILGPAVDRRLSAEREGVDPTDTDRIDIYPPDGTLPPNPPDPPEEPGPVVVTDPIPIPWPVDDPRPDPLPEPEPPPGTSPPPTPDPGSQCCPVADPPIVNVYLTVPGSPPSPYPGGSPPTSPYPPPPPGPTPEPEPPEDWRLPPYGPIPDPPKPPPPPPPPPAPSVIHWTDVPFIPGLHDKKSYCDWVGDCKAAVMAPNHNTGFVEIIADIAGALVSAIPGMRDQGGKAHDGMRDLLSFAQRNSGILAAQPGIADPMCVGSVVSLLAIPSVIQHYTGIDIEYSMEPLKQVMRHSSPTLIPDQGAIDAAYIGNKITLKEWECYTRANGNIPDIHYKAMMVGARQMEIPEAAAARRRGLISVQQYRDSLRDDGILDDKLAEAIYKLGDYIPPVSDIMRWMTKDVANEQYVQFAQLDEGFAESWSPQFAKWASDNGVSAEQVKYEYRAQWQDLSPTTIYSMVHRLRPGRVDASVAFTAANALDLLKIQEVPAGFRQRMLEIAYVPINRTDIIAMRKAGTMDEAESVERMMDLGYSPADAKVQATFITMKVAREEQASMGAWTQRRIIKEYIGGTVTEDDAFKLLGRTVLDPWQRREALKDADLIRSAQSRAKCIKGVRRRYFTGQIKGAEAVQWLQAYGLDQAVIDEMVAGWQCERDSKSKEPTIQMLTSWVSKGIITWDQFGERLTNLGYTKDDVQRIRIATDIDDRKAKFKEARSEADYQERKARQRKKDAEDAAKKAQGGKK